MDQIEVFKNRCIRFQSMDQIEVFKNRCIRFQSIDQIDVFKNNSYLIGPCIKKTLRNIYTKNVDMNL